MPWRLGQHREWHGTGVWVVLGVKVVLGSNLCDVIPSGTVLLAVFLTSSTKDTGGEGTKVLLLVFLLVLDLEELRHGTLHGRGTVGEGG